MAPTHPDTATELVDSHCHLNFARYQRDLSAVLERAAAAGIRRAIIPAVDLAGSREVAALTTQWDGCFGAVGIHPNSSNDISLAQLPQICSELQQLSRFAEIVAIGEIGLDFYRDHSPPEQQEKVLRAQLDLAAEVALPVILHNRDATAALLDILEEWVADLPLALQGRAGVLHSFSGDGRAAERALKAGFYLGFGGPLTYPSAAILREVAVQVPLERILLETDGPFLTPIPYRGQRNEPAYLTYIAERLANLRGISRAEVDTATTANAERLFALP